MVRNPLHASKETRCFHAVIKILSIGASRHNIWKINIGITIFHQFIMNFAYFLGFINIYQFIVDISRYFGWSMRVNTVNTPVADIEPTTKISLPLDI